MEYAEAKAKNGGKSLFLTNASKLGANVALGALAGNSKAMVPGYAGTIVDIDYAPIPQTPDKRIPLLREDQTFTQEDGTVITLGKVGQLPWAATIMFADKRTMTVGLFVQGQDKTTIKFLGESSPIPTYSIPADSLVDRLVGKTIKCTKYVRDSGNVIERAQQNEKGEILENTRKNNANCYTFEEIDAVAKP